MEYLVNSLMTLEFEAIDFFAKSGKDLELAIKLKY
jgi:hypothetical protein